MKRQAVVAGAGPAGLSAAIGLSRLGFQVEVFEERKEWSPRVCGSFLSPEAGEHLRWLGILDEVRSCSAPCGSVVLFAGDRSSAIPMVQPGFAIARKDLEEILLKKASQENVSIRWGMKITEPPPCDIFIAAAGRFSQFREKTKPMRTGWYAFNVQFRDARQNPGELSLHFFPKAYAGSLTFPDGTTNVSGLVHEDLRFKFSGGWDDILNWMRQRDAKLDHMLENSQKSSLVKGIPFLPFGPHYQEDQDFYSVGDNAAVCDPYMGEGISRALSAGPMIYLSLKGRLLETNWKKEGWRRYLKVWERAYFSRQRLGKLTRPILKNQAGISVLRQMMAGNALIRSYFLRRIHQGPVWTEGH